MRTGRSSALTSLHCTASEDCLNTWFIRGSRTLHTKGRNLCSDLRGLGTEKVTRTLFYLIGTHPFMGPEQRDPLIGKELLMICSKLFDAILVQTQTQTNPLY